MFFELNSCCNFSSFEYNLSNSDLRLTKRSLYFLKNSSETISTSKAFSMSVNDGLLSEIIKGRNLLSAV